MDSFTLTTIIPARPEEIFKSWLSSEGHSQMTGSPAKVEGKPDGAFNAWDGYIWGKTIELEQPHRIVQSWRTSEFPEDSTDSRVEIILEKHASGTQVTLIHKNIPAGQGENYKQGWDDFYFNPMRTFFSK